MVGLECQLKFPASLGFSRRSDPLLSYSENSVGFPLYKTSCLKIGGRMTGGPNLLS